MPKLHLKRTRAEEEERQLRKERKAARRAARGRSKSGASPLGDDPGEGPSHKRRATHPTTDPLNDFSDGDSHAPHPHASKQDYASILARLEEARFRDKLSGAAEDDAGIYAVQERLNSFGFVRVPERWRGLGDSGETGGAGGDPRYMDDEEYAEWVRMGMYKRKHPAEHASAQHQQALKAERIARQKALKAESIRLEQTLEQERAKRKEEREKRRWEAARGTYERRWEVLLSVGEDAGEGGEGLKFEDIPWPIYAPTKKLALTLDDLTHSAISSFLLPDTPTTAQTPLQLKMRKDLLRAQILRFHPDKFEGRVMGRVEAGEERERVREGVGRVVRVLNGLMGVGDGKMG